MTLPFTTNADASPEATRSDEEFLVAFESAALPRPEWTHAAHLRMAYLYLRDAEPLHVVLPRIRERIIAFNLANGNRSGYHETITVALVRIVGERLVTAPADTFDAFHAANRDLFADGLVVLGRHYSEALLFSPEARTRFVTPDRDPLPAGSVLGLATPPER
jgi:hypothetical protein